VTAPTGADSSPHSPLENISLLSSIFSPSSDLKSSPVHASQRMIFRQTQNSSSDKRDGDSASYIGSDSDVDSSDDERPYSAPK
jgi:hypothetical protein